MDFLSSEGVFKLIMGVDIGTIDAFIMNVTVCYANQQLLSHEVTVNSSRKRGLYIL